MLKTINKNIYFVQIPKTAGNSVRIFLNTYSGGSYLNGKTKEERAHYFGVRDAYRVGHISFKIPYFPCYIYNKKYLKSDFSFTVVRNPFDLLVSYYFHFATKGDWVESGWVNVNGHHEFQTFRDFITSYCDPSFEWHVPLLKRNLYSQLFDENGNSLVNYALWFENLYPNLKTLLGMCGKPKDKKYVFSVNNRSKKRKRVPYHELYDKDLVKMVEEKCKWELETFNYRFGITKQKLKRPIKDISDLKWKYEK